MFDSRIINLDTVGVIISLGGSVHRDYVNRGWCLWIWPCYRGMVIEYGVVRRPSFATSSQAYFRQSFGVFLTSPLNLGGWRTLPLARLFTSTMVQHHHTILPQNVNQIRQSVMNSTTFYYVRGSLTVLATL